MAAQQRTVRVLRSATGEYQSFSVETYPKMSVLDALFQIQRDQDRTLAFRCSCRLGMCGTCAVVVNGREGLACQTLLERFEENEIAIRPLNYLPIIKDLACDMEPFFDRYRSVKPHFVPKDSVQQSKETAVIPQAHGQRKWVDPALGCINCGICMSACSVVGLDPTFAGPMSLNRALTLANDERDAQRDERLNLVSGEHGIFKCHQLINCTNACPRHLAPTRAIRQLRQEYLSDHPTPLTAPIRWVSKKLSPS